MIGDPLQISAKDFKNAKDILKTVAKNKIILIGGGSGTSKSECAYSVQRLLWDKRKSSFVISLDDYYKTHATVRAEYRKKKGLDYVGICEIEWELINRMYKDFNNEKQIHFKRTHRFLDNIEFNTISSKHIDYLIIEGLYANYIKKIFSENLSIFLEGSPAQTLAFRELRGKEDETDEFRTQVVQKEYNVVSQLKRYADIVLSFQE